MTHVPYILAAYVATAVVLIGMIAWVAIDLRGQKRKLRELETDGRRRSGIAR
ncbi:MAG: heme exporter protein CcmD [Pseudomonadota bacterium]|nr:heme exporter protein CcmD [Pseudomonadota bacterium]